MSATKLYKARNGFWYVSWSEGRRSKRESLGTQEEAGAREALKAWLDFDDRDIGKQIEYTVADLWAIYDAKHIQMKVVNGVSLKWCWRNLEKHFGALSLPEVSAAADNYVGKRSSGAIGKKARPATIRKELAALRACFNWCANPTERKPLIDKAAIPGFALPPAGEPRDRWLKTDEIQRLLDAAAKMRSGTRLSRGERFLWIALETAGRKSAILDLTWDRVDFETNVIHLRDPDQPATKKRRASVPISKALLPVLVRAFKEKKGDLVMDNKADVWATVQCIADAAGFAPKREPRRNGAKPKASGIGPHTLRHTAATHMARRGVPLWKIAKILGNTLTMVERVYAKHSPDDLREAVDMISRGDLAPAE